MFRLIPASEGQSLDGDPGCTSWTWVGMRDHGPDAGHVAHVDF
ncbi:hypothetical protein [Undibacterium sp. JH2W]